MHPFADEVLAAVGPTGLIPDEAFRRFEARLQSSNDTRLFQHFAALAVSLDKKGARLLALQLARLAVIGERVTITMHFQETGSRVEAPRVPQTKPLSIGAPKLSGVGMRAKR